MIRSAFPQDAPAIHPYRLDLRRDRIIMAAVPLEREFRRSMIHSAARVFSRGTGVTADATALTALVTS